ncbi:hypothetical protein GF354_01870 [Candidatus Peregrinibacteria bacterium]|nr:hypothetical protein [Candidatus Peregrinibacteria bacterium]
MLKKVIKNILRLTVANKNLLWGIGILCAFFMFAYNTVVYTNQDNSYTIETAYSIATEFNLDLNEFSIEDLEHYNVIQVEDKVYNYFPNGTSILISPVVYLLDLAGVDVIKSDVTIRKLLAAFFVALSCVILFFTYRKRSYLVPFLLIAIYFFCTPVISTASMDLWSQTPLLPIYAFTIYVLHKGLYKKNKYLLSSFGFLYFSFLIRPTSAIPILLLSIYLIVKDYRSFLKTVPIGIALLGLWLMHNYLAFDNLLHPYFYNRVYTNDYLGGLLGLLFSPARGIIFFSPFILFGFLGLRQSLKQKDKLLPIIFLLIITVCYLITAIERLWWGGWCMGPRFFTELMPFFMYFIWMAFEYIGKMKKKRIAMSLIIIFIILATYSLNIFISLSYRIGPEIWNMDPNNINENIDRLWDFSDLAYTRAKPKLILK